MEDGEVFALLGLPKYAASDPRRGYSGASLERAPPPPDRYSSGYNNYGSRDQPYSRSSDYRRSDYSSSSYASDDRKPFFSGGNGDRKRRPDSYRAPGPEWRGAKDPRLAVPGPGGDGHAAYADYSYSGGGDYPPTSSYSQSDYAAGYNNTDYAKAAVASDGAANYGSPSNAKTSPSSIDRQAVTSRTVSPSASISPPMDTSVAVAASH